MTTRLIDADKLIDDLSDLKRSPWANEPWASDQRKLGIREALDMIQSIVRVDSQTVDAVPVRHGKWGEGLECYSDDFIVCSICGEAFNVLDNDTYRFNYCPKCGARMDEDETD